MMRFASPSRRPSTDDYPRADPCPLVAQSAAPPAIRHGPATTPLERQASSLAFAPTSPHCRRPCSPTGR
ncbi:hypothetical protein QJS66_11855 [Kocuria rhizophila]|nr:hypothetical protein QJS66_11855 [Kocuria rhizophila]